MGKSKGRKKKNKARKGPPFLSEFSKTATDLLRKDYGSEYKMLRVSTLTASGVAIHSTAMYKRQTPVAIVDTLFNYKNTNFNVHFVTIPQISANLSLSKQIMPSTTVKASLSFPNFSSKISTNFSVSQQVFQYLTAKASLKLPNYNFCKITFCSLHQHAALAMCVGLNNRSPEVAFQASLGTQSLAVGMQTTYRTASSCFQPWMIGIQGTYHGDTASLLYSTKGNKLKATILHSLDKEMKFSAVLDIIQSLSTCTTTFTAAGSWAIDDRTVVKARVDHHGTLKTLLRHSIENYKSLISISGEFDVKDLKKKPKIGLAIVIMP